MGIELRLPNISGNDKEQLVQIRSYLYQIIPQLQWALNNVSATEVSSGAIDQIAKRISSASVSGAGGTSVSAEVTFDKLKPLIIKSAEIVEAYYEEINKRLEGLYVAESDFGTFMEKTTQDIEATSTYVNQKFEDVQVIISEEIEGVSISLNDTLSTSLDNVLVETDSKISEEVTALNNTINAKIGEVNASIEDVDGEIVNVKARIDNTNREITATNARIDNTNKKITEVEKSIEDTNTRIDDVNASIAETNAEISGVNNLITEANGKIDGLTDAINDTNDNINILIEAKDLNAEDVEKLNTELSKINDSIGEINTTVDSIETDVSNIDTHVKEVDGQIVEINESVSLVGEKTAELDDSVAKAEQSIIDTNAKVDDTSGAVENLKADVNDTSNQVAILNSAVADANKNIADLKIAIIEANAYIRSGLLYYDGNAIPVYGLEVGQRNIVNGEEVFNKYARFTSDKLSFYDKNDNEVAYISDKKLFISNVEITSSFKFGGFVDTIMASGDIVTKWVGGEG